MIYKNEPLMKRSLMLTQTQRSDQTGDEGYTLIEKNNRIKCYKWWLFSFSYCYLLKR